MTIDTTMTSGNVPATNKRRAVVAKFDITKFAKKDDTKGGKDPVEPDADDKKKPGKGGKFKKAYTAKFGK